MKQQKNRNKKRGVTLIEIVMAIGIILIISSYSVIKYQRMRIKNAMDSDKLKITTGIINTNIRSADVYKTSDNTIMQDKTDLYMKFGNNGMIILIQSPSNPGDLVLLSDTGENTQKLKEKNVYSLFNCGESSKILSCPIMILQSKPDLEIDSFATVKENLPDKKNDSKITTDYINFYAGVPLKSFTVYTFDEKGIVKNRIKVTGKDQGQKLMLLEKYIYEGPQEIGTAWTRDNIVEKNKTINFFDKEIVGLWSSDDNIKVTVPVEIK